MSMEFGELYKHFKYYNNFVLNFTRLFMFSVNYNLRVC